VEFHLSSSSGFSNGLDVILPGVVMEAKAQLVGIRDRVRSDVEGSSPAPAIANTSGEGKRVVSASNPEAKDAADLLRYSLNIQAKSCAVVPVNCTSRSVLLILFYQVNMQESC